MTQVDFYILGDNARSDRYHLACRLANKAWQQQRRVYLHVASKSEGHHLDKLLWTIKEDDFLPHGLATSANPDLNPVLIGFGNEVGEEHDVLINLTGDVPEFFSRFERVAELVDRDQETRNAGRTRYRYYRDRGYPLNSYNIQ
ncbi:MAG: DNA polymerase III subunit chi [Gammaproteobacteria bacterium]|nr:DNA polymerase III subunit chi [Gammaproteobacteria bacterium]